MRQLRDYFLKEHSAAVCSKNLRQRLLSAQTGQALRSPEVPSSLASSNEAQTSEGMKEQVNSCPPGGTSGWA